MPEIVILSATRTPIGSFQGALATVPANRQELHPGVSLDEVRAKTAAPFNVGLS